MWAYFVAYIILGAFLVFNVFIAVVVKNVQDINAEMSKVASSEIKDGIDEIDEIEKLLVSLNNKISNLKKTIYPDN